MAWTIWCFTTWMYAPHSGWHARSCSAPRLGWLAAEWAVRYPEMLRALILVDAFGLRLPEAPATDLLRLDATQMRQVLFADPHAAVAQDLIPDVPAPESSKRASGRARRWRVSPGSSRIIPSCSAISTASGRQR